MSYIHQPVLMVEVLKALQPKAGGKYVDGTLGQGGHSLEILKVSSPTGWLYGSDQDSGTVEIARARLAEFTGRFELRVGNFGGLDGWIGGNSVNGVLLDLGISSWQLDDPERGLSFQADGPLDMRMDRNGKVTAAKLVNELGHEELAKIFWEYGGEENSRRIAKAIEHDRGMRRFERTGQLAGLIERLVPRGGRKTHPATKVFQALRIAVNDEMGALKRGLDAALKILVPDGRLAVITFHSLEDRMVRDYGRRLSRDYEPGDANDTPEFRQPRPPKLRLVERKAVQPSEEEIRNNPRSRSAQLRVFEKLKT